MKILISSRGEKTVKLLVPTRLIFNRLTGFIVAKALSKYVSFNENINISSYDINRIIKEFIRMKKKFPDLVLVDIESSNGDIIQIKL